MSQNCYCYFSIPIGAKTQLAALSNPFYETTRKLKVNRKISKAGFALLSLLLK